MWRLSDLVKASTYREHKHQDQSITWNMIIISAERTEVSSSLGDPFICPVRRLGTAFSTLVYPTCLSMSYS